MKIKELLLSPLKLSIEKFKDAVSMIKLISSGFGYPDASHVFIEIMLLFMHVILTFITHVFILILHIFIIFVK